MLNFWAWLIEAERHYTVPPSVLQGYEHEFRRELERLIHRTADPVLRAKFEDMLHCPIRDSQGHCREFSEYILSALIKNGVHNRYDIEAALSYVIQQMLMDRSFAGGQLRPTVFGAFDPNRPYTPNFNPLQARFMSFLQNAVRNIVKGRIPRLSNVERRPQGTVSIGQGRRREGDPGGAVSPDDIAAKPSADADLAEMVEDITGLLRKKEAAYGLPLVDLFRAIMSGIRTEEQRTRFGDRRTRLGRQVIVQTVEDYARSTGNDRLLNLLKRSENFRSMPPVRKPVKTVKPQLPEKDRDYASIVNVIERLGRPVGSADLGRYRRRWLEYPPREAASGHRNRLEDVLARMVADQVILATRTRQGATVYSPGPNFAEYRHETLV